MLLQIEAKAVKNVLHFFNSAVIANSKVHLFILTIAIINPLRLKIFEYFFHTVFDNEGLPFYWVEVKTFLSMAFMF